MKVVTPQVLSCSGGTAVMVTFVLSGTTGQVLAVKSVKVNGKVADAQTAVCIANVIKSSVIVPPFSSATFTVSYPFVQSQTQSHVALKSDLCPYGEMPHQVMFYVKKGNRRKVENTLETQAITNDVLNLVRQFLKILQQHDFVSLKLLFTQQVYIKEKHLNIEPPEIESFVITASNIDTASMRKRLKDITVGRGFGDVIEAFCRWKRVSVITSFPPDDDNYDIMSEEIVANEGLNRLEYTLRWPAYCGGDENNMKIKIRKLDSLKISGISFVLGWIGCGA